MRETREAVFLLVRKALMEPEMSAGKFACARRAATEGCGMSKLSQACSLHPYFKIREGNLDAFLALMPAFVEKTSEEPACLYYDFTRNGDVAYCREAYVGAAGILAHLENVGELLGKFLELSDLIRLEVHGPEAEINKLREPMAALKPDFFIRAIGLETSGE